MVLNLFRHVSAETKVPYTINRLGKECWLPSAELMPIEIGAIYVCPLIWRHLTSSHFIYIYIYNYIISICPNLYYTFTKFNFSCLRERERERERERGGAMRERKRAGESEFELSFAHESVPTHIRQSREIPERMSTSYLMIFCPWWFR